MPRWPDEVLGASFFLFNSKEDAESGCATGGCGFFTSVPWEGNPRMVHVYAVTCAHVIAEAKPYHIRAHKAGSREPTFIKADRSLWSISESDDLAAMLVPNGPAYVHENFLKMNLTDEIIDEYSIGIGDEVFSVGRFVDLANQRVNRPLVRSGIIAAMPTFPVLNDTGQAIDSYIVEMRSRSGFSGSPVYAYGPWLLGVHWGEIKIKGPDGTPWLDANTVLSKDRRGLELGSGMIGVVPCSRLEALLMTNEDTKKRRRKMEKEFSADALPQRAGGDDEAGESVRF